MNYLEQVYQDSYKNQLEKIAEANGVDPEKFLLAMEKIAAKPPVEAAKSIGSIILESFGNLGKGISSGAEFLKLKGGSEALKLKGAEKGWGKKRDFNNQLGEFDKQMKNQKENMSAFGRSKAALGIIGGTGVLGAGGVALASRK